ncbi:MoaB/Mog domain-containing protein [Favolaschia claudopus]|uniref:molybdopterin molybdotransferase n=1 Tax=Favolaschia claudopus TaxID=2862362 RepID=A0AAV9ZLS0_9AGAR
MSMAMLCVVAADRPGVYQVLTSQSHRLTVPIPADSIYRVNTYTEGPLSAETDAVIMVEDTRLVSTYTGADGSDGEGEEKEVECHLAQVPAGENKVKMYKSLVYKRPVVALLSTGNELLDLQNPHPQSGDDWGGIRTDRRYKPHCAASVTTWSTWAFISSHVEAIQKGLDTADILLTTGGTSMGPTDLLKPVIARHFSGTIHFGRVTVKPGKPTTFATIPCAGDVAKPVFALPGNPASALVMFNVFVVPALRKLGGWPESRCQLAPVPVKLASPMNLDPRTEFHRVVIKADMDGLRAFSTGGQRSSRVASLSGANCFVVLPMRTQEQSRLEAGTVVSAMLIGEILNV